MEENIKIEELSSVERKICIHVPQNEVDKKFDDFFTSIKKNAQMPGFRKGKAPVSFLKRYFSDKAKGTVSQLLLSEYFEKIIKDYNINPVSAPKFTTTGKDYVGTFEGDNSYTVEMTVEILPKIEPIGYADVDLKFPKNDSNLVFEQKMLEYREQFAERSQITDRGAQVGDALIIDFKGFVDGVAFQGGEASGHAINKLGSANLIPGFEDQMVGMKTGETKTITVTFPETYGAKHLASKEAKFDITLHSIVETKLAEVNDDLALMVGYQNTDELKKHVQDDANDHLNHLNKRFLEEQIVQKLLDINKFDVPLSMVDSEKKRILQHIGNNKVQQDMIDAMALRGVKRAIILDAIYEKEPSVEVTPDELDKMLEQHAKMYGKTKDEIVSMLYSTHQMDAFLGTLRAQRVVDFIINKAKEREEANGRDKEGQASSDGV